MNFSPVASGMVLTSTGTLLCVVLLLPSCPKASAPQVAIVPSEHTTMLWALHAVTPVTVLPASTPLVTTATATLLCVVLLLPSCPLEFKPQVATVPSEHRAMLWEFPAATAMTVLPASAVPAVVTAMGTLLFVVLLLPSCPLLFCPQATRVPSEHNAMQ